MLPSYRERSAGRAGRAVAVIVVEPSSAPPLRYDGRTWIRVGSTTRFATAEEEAILTERRQAANLPVPLAPDLYSVQGLRNLGPTLAGWRREWQIHLANKPDPGIRAPSGDMHPQGYVVLQHGTRVDRVVGAYDRWLQKVPGEYRKSVLQQPADFAPRADDDEHCLGLLKHYHSLAPLAQEARKPLFMLRSADGAIGAHQQSVRDAYGHFEALARRLIRELGPR